MVCSMSIVIRVGVHFTDELPGIGLLHHVVVWLDAARLLPHLRTFSRRSVMC